MALTISTHKTKDVLVLELSGKLTSTDPVGGLRDLVRDLLSDGNRAFVLNLTNVSYIDSTCLGQIVATYVSARKKHGHVVLLTPTPRAEHLLHIAKLDTVFELYEDEATAVEAVAKEVAAPPAGARE